MLDLAPTLPCRPAQHMAEMLTLTTRMNALARITLGNVNIAATTALQVGAEVGGRAGAAGRPLGSSVASGSWLASQRCQCLRLRP